VRRVSGVGGRERGIRVNEPERIEIVIIPPSEASKIVELAGKVYLKDCVCRVREQACSRDVDVCLHFEGAQQEDLRDARTITKDEALAILRRTAEWDAIHQLFYTQTSRQVTELCSCCTCCCTPLRRLNESGDYSDQPRSGYVALTDVGACVGCGQCEESCFFGARWTEQRELHFADERCFGCGRCINSCPEGAITLKLEAGRGVPLPGVGRF
jgi:ferredoxin